jgi:hypothetical protein
MRLASLLVVGALIGLAPVDAFAQKKQRDLITAEEIEKGGWKDRDLLSTIRGLRAHFLELPKGVRSISGGGNQYPLLVVIDGARQGQEILEQTLATDVKEIRYLEPSRAQNEFGINANGGAIVIKTVAGRKKEK